MPHYIKDLVFVLTVGGLAFLTTIRPLVPIIGRQSSWHWIIIWTMVTACTFIVRDFWLTLALCGIILFLISKFERDRAVLYLLTFCLAPAFAVTMPGIGGINNLATLTYQDFLAILLLFPIVLTRDRMPDRSGKIPATLLFIYFCLVTLLTLRQTTVTDTMRTSLSYFLGMIVPFLAFAKGVDKAQRMQRLLLALIFVSLPLALIGALELIKGWHVYESAFESWGTMYYTARSGLLRSGGPVSDSIPFGLFFMVSIGFCLGIPAKLLSRKSRVMLFTTLIIGLFSTLSRGPWLGTFVIVLVFLLTGPKPLRSLLKFITLGGISAILLYPFPIWGKIMDILPYVGSEVNTGTADYRVKLLNNAWIVINRNPFFGSVDYFNTPEMQEMMQGQHIIDVVNSYIGVALQTGFVGLSVFLLFFLACLIGLARAVLSLPETEFELKLMGRALFATLFGTLVTIFTVSSVSIIPYIYWILAGLCVAQTRIIRIHLSTSRSTVTTPRSMAELRKGAARRNSAAQSKTYQNPHHE